MSNLYTNPLHPPIKNGQQSGYSALGSAVASQAGGGRGPRFRLAQGTYSPASKWHSTTGKASVIHGPILFDYKGRSKQGVSMRELSARSVGDIMSMVQGGEDRVLAQTGLQRISFRILARPILWPGYAEWNRSIEITADGPITRAKLGQMIAQNFSRFMESNRAVPTANGDWSISKNGFRFDHLILLSLINVFEDSWQADVMVNLL